MMLLVETIIYSKSMMMKKNISKYNTRMGRRGIQGLLLSIITICSLYHDTMGFSASIPPLQLSIASDRQPSRITTRLKQLSASPLKESSRSRSNKETRHSDSYSFIQPSETGEHDDDNHDGDDPDAILPYDLGVSDGIFQTGSLSQRMYQTVSEKQQSSSSVFSGEAGQRVLKMMIMDNAAKEAVRVALVENGLDMVAQDPQENWGKVESIRLVIDKNSNTNSVLYNDWEEAVDHWTPGQGYDFVVKNVLAKVKGVSLDEWLLAYDPDGELRQQAKEAGMLLPGEIPQTLQEMTVENTRRVEASPREALTEKEAYSGDLQKRGYRPIHASALSKLNEDGTLDHATMMHVMDAMVTHGCLMVDLTDGGRTFDTSKGMASMWTASEKFFQKVDNAELPEEIKGMTTAEEVGSTHAKVGFGSYDGGNLQFLETRLSRKGELLPVAAQSLLGQNGVEALTQAFMTMTSIAKDITRTVVAACSEEVGALYGKLAIEGATRLVNELLDDSTPIQTDVAHSEGPVSMSPHRLCRYSNKNKEEGKASKKITQEIFGAHTDSTFITVVPVAQVPGLEVYDEDEGRWYRPEKAARHHWENEQKELGKDPTATSDHLDDGTEIPWHARYIVMMPGELLQLVSRSEVLAAVHRVVATQERPSRLSAPILLRGRPGIRLDSKRYLGGTMDDPILKQCDGMKIEGIYDGLQAQPVGSQKEEPSSDTDT